jgi:phosphoribosylaminoimidazole-succinocarboxamide synthase
MSQADWDAASAAAMALFAFGQQEARKRGLLLVDTKYEFGRDAEDNVLLIDEIHTPDSSRYWLAESYEQRHAAGEVCADAEHKHCTASATVART